jgi:hypothetical protein
MKVTLNGFLHFMPEDYGVAPEFRWFHWDGPIGRSICIRPQSIEVDVPDDFNPVAAQVAALQDEVAKAAKDFFDTQQRIKKRISELQAIGCATEIEQ